MKDENKDSYPYYKIGSKFISKVNGCVYTVIDNVSEDRFNIRKKQCVIGREDDKPEALGYGFRVENIIPFEDLGINKPTL